MLRNDQLEQWDRETFLHPSTHHAQHARGASPARIIRTAEGCRITDRDGKSFLDGFAGLFCVNVGYGRTEIADAMAAQAHELAFYHAYVGHGTEASVTLAKMVIDRAPEHMSRVYFGLGGSDANETNVKLAWYVNNIMGRPEKKKIISRHRAYHGSALISGSLTGLDLFHKQFDLPFSMVLRTVAPDYYGRADRSLSETEFSAWCAAELETLIEAEGADTIAAFIAEPVMGTGGIVPPPEGYWPAISAVLEKHDIALIADEVVTGFGRLGSMFGSDHYGLKPDYMTVAKGLTSAYAPLSGSIISERVWKVLEEGTDKHGSFGHGFTYSAHPVSAAAGVANLKLLDEMKLIENVRKVGPYFLNALRRAVGDHPHVGDVRGVGMLAGVEFVKDRAGPVPFPASETVAPRIVAALMERGVIGRAMPQSNVLGFAPPLCLSEAEADEIAGAVAEAVRAVLG